MENLFHLRPATPADIDRIAELEVECFADPWSRWALAWHYGDLFVVAESGGGVAGYVIARHAGDEGEILNLAVDPACRRQGVASRLFEEARRRMTAAGVQRVFLEVRESNLAARRFYAGHGFREVGRRRGYYRDPTEDAVCCECPM